MRLFTSAVVLWTLLGHIVCRTYIGPFIYNGCHHVNSRPLGSAHWLHPFVATDCFQVCSGNGHDIAGLDSINSMCYCGEGIFDHTTWAAHDLCSPCNDSLTIFCGGKHTLSIYHIKDSKVTDNSPNEHREIESEFGEEPVILLAAHGGVFSYNSSSQVLKHVITVDYHVDAIDYHLRRKEGFAIWDDFIYRFPLFEEHVLEESQAKVVGDVNRCPTFAVDWVHDKVYWPNCYSHHITVVDINADIHQSEEIVIYLLDEGAWAMDMAVDPYKGLLFWTSGATLWTCRLDGRGLRKVVPEFPVNRVSSLSLDMAAERIYFAGLSRYDKNSSLLVYAGYNGSVSHSLQFLEYEGGHHISCFGIFGPHIYFVENNSSVVVSSKLEYDHRPSVIVDVREVEVKHLKLVHPKLQAPGKEDACTNRGCSHMCAIEASLPRCYCLRYHELEHDNRTCILSPGEEEEMHLMLMICNGVMLVLIVLGGAGVLMCLCDKLWSQLHPTVVRLTVPGAATHSFTGLRREDGENLI